MTIFSDASRRTDEKVFLQNAASTVAGSFDNATVQKSLENFQMRYAAADILGAKRPAPSMT